MIKWKKVVNENSGKHWKIRNGDIEMGFVDFGTNSLLKIKYDELPLTPNDFDIIIFQRSSFWEYFPGLEKKNCSILISFSERRIDGDKKSTFSCEIN